MKPTFFLSVILLYSAGVIAQTNAFPATGNVGIGTLTPFSKLTIRSGMTGVSIEPMGNPYFGTISLNRDAATGTIFDPTGHAFQINNGGTDKNLHIQVYNGNGSQVTNDALVISGANGNVGIGISNPTDKLSVNGNIRAKEIKVETANWPDYVFANSYELPSLNQLESYIKIHQHLPGMPSATQAEQSGIDLGEMNRKLLEKVEELTLHLLAVNSKVEKELILERAKTKEKEMNMVHLENRINKLEELLVNMSREK